MALTPKKMREIVFQLLFSYDFYENKQEDLTPIVMEKLKVTRKNVLIAFEKVRAILDKQSVIDQKIRELSTEYRLERISRAERSVLRLGIYELLYDEELPEKVAIAEAIRLCKKFGSPEGSKFVNAILDAVLKDKSKLKKEI